MVPFFREEIVDMKELASLIKSDFDLWGKMEKLFCDDSWEFEEGNLKLGRDVCGILFAGRSGYATNGYWLIKFNTVDSLSPNSVLFYHYDSEEVIDENPFLNYGLSLDKFRGIFEQWRPYNFKLRVEDVNTVLETIPSIKERRSTLLSIYPTPVKTTLSLVNRKTYKVTNSYDIPTYANKFSKNNLPDTPKVITVNMNYFDKIIKIVCDYYNVIELCFSDSVREPLLIKCSNNRGGKPLFKFALAQINCI